jgi:hypothetical protein
VIERGVANLGHATCWIRQTGRSSRRFCIDADVDFGAS